MESERYAMVEIFEECQLNVLCHDRLCVKLKSIYDNSRFSHFADDFFELCRYSLISNERSLYRERTIDFITKFALFCGKSEENNPEDTLNNRLLAKLFLFCLKYNDCSNPAVRFRCTQIIHKLLEGIGDNGIMSNELYEGLRTALLRRVYDVKASVRIQAIQALSRMQDPTDGECPCVGAFIWLARHDSASDVRRAALAAMVLTTHTLPSVIERCRDLADCVRRTAYKILATRSVLRPLSIAKRIRVLQDGLSDRSEIVRHAAQELVISWFNVVEKDPVMLLRRLDTEGVPETSQLLLDDLFTILPVDELVSMIDRWSNKYLTDNHVLKSDCLTSEATFFWRALLEFLRKKQPTNKEGPQNPIGLDAIENPDHVDPLQHVLDVILPSVSDYVDFAKNLVDQLVQSVLSSTFNEKTMEQQCMVEQVLLLANSLDLSDEFGRRRLVSLVHEWISGPQVPSSLAPQLLKLHAMLEPNLRRRINNLIEMISELCDPVEPHQLPSTTPQPSTNLMPKTPSSVKVDLNQAQSVPNEVEDIPKETKKRCERTLRLKIASLEVRINELNEALHNCVLRKDFERATELRDECQKLECERTELLREIHGEVGLQNREIEHSPQANGSNHMECETVTKPDSDENQEENEKLNEDAPQSLFERCSVPILLKANRIAALIVQQSPSLWRLPASLRSLLDSLILPSIQHDDPSVRNQAILALGLCCTMDLPLTLQYFPLFYSAMSVDHVMISETALGCIIDCLLLYGFRPFHDAKIRLNSRLSDNVTVSQDEDEDDDDDNTVESSNADYIVLTCQSAPENDGNPGTTTSSVKLVRRKDMSKTAALLLKPIVALLEREDNELRTTSALGLAKLMLYDRIISSHLLSLLLLLWFNPVSEDYPAIRRGLACFFADYACGNSTTSSRNSSVSYEHQAALADAVLPTLTTLIRAPASSPLSEVEAYDVASLLARLTDTKHLSSTTTRPNAADVPNTDESDKQQPSDSTNPESGTMDIVDNPHHDKLALQLASEVLKAPQSAEAKLYLRMLCQIRPSTGNLEVYKELLILIESVSKYIDRSSALFLHRFRKQVTEQLIRLGINPTTILKPPTFPNHAESLQLANENCSADVDRTLVADGSIETNVQENQPTLLGSARSNLHLANRKSDTLACDNFTSFTFGQQVNRTLIDKSNTRIVLDFSDEDEDDNHSKMNISQDLPVEQPQRKSTRKR